MKIDEGMMVLIEFLESHKGEVKGFRYNDYVKGFDYAVADPHEFKSRKIENPVKGTRLVKIK